MADRDPMPDSQVGGGEGRGGRDSKANMARASVAELTGTAILVFVGTAVATGAILARPTAGDPYDSLTVAAAFGLTPAALVGALGHVSGAHLNPGVTLALAGARKFSVALRAGVHRSWEAR